MKHLIAILSALAIAGCAGLPARSYSLSYTDTKGRTVSGGVTLQSTEGLKK